MRLLRLKGRTFGALLAALSLLAAGVVPSARGALPQAGEGALTVALPPGGEVFVENRRGGVAVEVWGEEHIALSADAEAGGRGGRRRLPVRVGKSERGLTIRVERAAGARASRVDLRLSVPASARLSVRTSDGELSIAGAPAALDAQTISGDLRLTLPAPPDADVTAQSLNGVVALGEGFDGDGGPRERRGKFRARLGSGGVPLKLFSGRGRISLEARADFASRTRRGPPSSPTSPTESASAARRERVSAEPGEDAPVRQPTPAPVEPPQEIDEDEVVRVESELVTLNVSVVERASGRGLAGLAAEDFRLYEDNVEQSIAHFESSDAPFDLVLLLDLSGSTARVTDTIRRAASRFIAATRPQDRVAVVAFASASQVVSPLTSDRRRLREAIDRMAPPQGDTRLYDALAHALEFAARETERSRRRAVILMSDGLDSTMPNVTGEGSALSFDEVRNRAQEFDGVLYTIWTSTEYEAFSPLDIQPETFELAEERMKGLADAGGGLFYVVERLEDLAGAYERVVADLGTVYSLSYRPTNKERDGRWRAIRVRLPRHPAAVARGKRGYNAN
ncbi:MAG TPA: VWA domain-containing protein [Pyrinomonadaceae bacterium]|nr:VWA domain-containing protein [Pyrinomonadaceae bacterium]